MRANEEAAIDDSAQDVVLPRTLRLEGAFNARDLGGYQTADGQQTRWRRLFRSGHLHRLAPDDIDHFHELGIRTVVDLRSDDELAWTGSGPLFERGVIRHVHRPFLGPSATAFNDAQPEDQEARRAAWFARGYERMLDTAGTAIASLFALLADDDNYPLVYHCVAGKDRTGVLSALILRALGVPDDAVVADYALTMEHRPAPDVLRQMLADYGTDIDLAPYDVWQAPAAVMQVTLRVIDERFGSTAGYLASIGVDGAHLAALRAIMLEPAGRAAGR
jgi:protein tyrosine/serine phosphatase